jgi:hypothetical protein
MREGDTHSPCHRRKYPARNSAVRRHGHSASHPPLRIERNHGPAAEPSRKRNRRDREPALFCESSQTVIGHKLNVIGAEPSPKAVRGCRRFISAIRSDKRRSRVFNVAHQRCNFSSSRFIAVQSISPSTFKSSPIMPTFNPDHVRKAVAEFSPRRPQKFQDLLPAREVIAELGQKKASYPIFPRLISQADVIDLQWSLYGQKIQPRPDGGLRAPEYFKEKICLISRDKISRSLCGHSFCKF